MRYTLTWLLIIAVIFLTFSCVRDTNFDETIQVSPIVELNLIHFNLDAGEFYDDTTSTPILIVRDTTEVSFLNETTIQESLKKAEFYYKFTNSIPKDFLIDFQFLDDANIITHTTQVSVTQGSINSPSLTEHFDIVEGIQLTQLLESTKLALIVAISSSDENIVGNLNMQSKTTYYLEF